VLPSENATGNYVKIVQRLPVKIDFDADQLKDYRVSPGMSLEPYVRVR
jgi:membrane fusion protein (multidrug efflux system)